jgi:DNA-binding HxlR family transcriptional regulator
MKDIASDCPVQKTAHLLSDMWTILIFRELLSSPARFCDIERNLVGISSRTLTIKLKKLESEGIVVKRVTSNQYELTKKGKGLDVVIDAMRAYGKRYLKK